MTEMGAAMTIKSPKASTAEECERLEQLPNIGPALAADLRLIGIRTPAELRGKDPCVLDTFMAATVFMRGAPAAPWWSYTAQRKALFGQV